MSSWPTNVSLIPSNRFGDIIAQYHGHVCELRGDALLAEFERASDAVTASVAFQASQIEYNTQLEDDIRPIVRIGIAMGEVIIADNTITGTGVVLAQRLEQLAKPGGVVVQGAAYETIPGRFPFEYANLGEHKVKGFDQAIRAYAASLKGDMEIPPPGPFHQLHRPRYATFVLFFAVLIGVGVALAWFKPWESREEVASVAQMAYPLPGKPSIAVLPFSNLSDDVQQEYFVDGMTEDLITDLSKVPELFVIARNSVFTYKGKTVKVRQVAEELGVRYVLEGSVRRVGDQVRINAQLIDATTGGHLWADRYDGSMADVFTLQDNVTQQIVGALALNLTQGETSGSRTVSSQAYDAFLKGWAHYQRHTADELTQAVSYLEQAIQLDEGYAQAHTALAAVYWEAWSNGWVERLGISSSDALGKAKQHLEQGKKEATPLAHWVASNIEISEGNYQKAISEAEQIVALDSNNPAGYVQLATAMELTGKSNEGLIEKAVRLNPNFSPLHDAAKKGDADAVRQMIEGGAQIDTKDYYGKTPLHVVSESGHTKIAALLIEAGADVEAKTKVISGAGLRGATPLILAAQRGHTGVAELLISADADVNARDERAPWFDVGTVLHYAAEAGHTDVAELLIDNGAEIDATNAANAYTPLTWATRKGYKAMTELLISRGASVNAVDASGYTPLHAAVMSEDFDIVQLLIANGADAHAKTVRGDYPGETPLHVAAFVGHIRIAKLLLANDADVNTTDKYGFTPLRRSVGQGHLTMVELLIKNDSDITTKDTSGITLLHVVAPTTHVAIAELLIAEGADINREGQQLWFYSVGLCSRR